MTIKTTINSHDNNDDTIMKKTISLTEMAKLKEEMEEEYKSRLENNQKEMEEMAKTFEERLKEAQLAAGVSSIHL